VLGVSFDPPERNRAFAERHGLPFDLLSDLDRRTALAYGACEAPTDAYPRRVTFVIGPQGHIEQALVTTDPAGQAEQLQCQLRARP
jgi:peroxiredoxin Q/BCP